MAPATVLLIDSDADSIAIYSLILRHHGFEVLQARDGETGLKLALENRPDVVVSELFLPPGPGGDVVDQLRRDLRTAETPMIVLDSVPSLARELSGGTEHLRRLKKPCEPTRLLDEVRKLLSARVPLTLE